MSPVSEILAHREVGDLGEELSRYQAFRGVRRSRASRCENLELANAAGIEFFDSERGRTRRPPAQAPRERGRRIPRSAEKAAPKKFLARKPKSLARNNKT